MELFTTYVPSVWLGLLGWSLTASLILDTSHLSSLRQQGLMIGTWGCWMFPAFDVAIHRKMIAPEAALGYAATMTIIPTILVWLISSRFSPQATSTSMER
ncbi:MAG: hypothetical protein HC884_16800 [Chloroflexaceae bacterium]|nr:hypothetical protein [Chloroflexaceae bacterium]